MGLLNTKEKKDLTDGLRFGSKVGAGLLVARILANSLLNRTLPSYGIQSMRGLGTAGVIYGVAGHKSRPELAVKSGGIGIGLGLGTLPVDWVGRYLPALGEKVEIKMATGPDAIDMEVVDIPKWAGRNYSYERVSDLLKKFVLEDTVNRKTGEVIPAGYKHPSVVWLTRNIIAEAGTSVYDPIGCANAISNWCWNNLTYVFDPTVTEAEDYFVHPYLLIKDYTDRGFAAGDCDDFAILTASMLLSIGLTPRYMLWAQATEAPETYTHITTALYLPEHRYPDLTQTFRGWPYYNIEATMKVDSNDFSKNGIEGATPGGLNYHPSTYKRGIIVITE